MHALFRQRAYLRGLSRRQRRNWFEQFKVARPRAPIGTLALPASVRRNYAYVVLQ